MDLAIPPPPVLKKTKCFRCRTSLLPSLGLPVVSVHPKDRSPHSSGRKMGGGGGREEKLGRRKENGWGNGINLCNRSKKINQSKPPILLIFLTKLSFSCHLFIGKDVRVMCCSLCSVHGAARESHCSRNLFWREEKKNALRTERKCESLKCLSSFANNILLICDMSAA